MKRVKVYLMLLLCIFSCYSKAYEAGNFTMSFRGVEPTTKTYCFDSSNTLNPNKIAIVWKILNLKGYKLVNTKEAAYRISISEGSGSEYSPTRIIFIDNKSDELPPILTIEFLGNSYKDVRYMRYPGYTGLYLFWGYKYVRLSFSAPIGSNSYTKIKMWRDRGNKSSEELNVKEWKDAEDLIVGRNYYEEYYAACSRVAQSKLEDVKKVTIIHEEKKELVESTSDIIDVDISIPQTMSTSELQLAVIFGNEKYQHVSQVVYANNDAHIFAEYCRKTLGLPDNNVKVYENASYGTMIGAMSDLQKIARVFKGNLNVIFYYAGHGIPNETTRDSYLLPIDVDGMNTEVCYPLTRLYKELGELDAKQVIVFIDACFSGAERGDGMVIASRGVTIKPKSNQPMGNTIVFSAATGQQAAYPYKEKRHGMFTYYLLKKLQETKGDVTMGELGEYICDEAAKQSLLTNGKEQTPVVLTSMRMSDDWKNWKLK